jgi:hypothetical protein
LSPAWTWLTDKASGARGSAENSFGESTQGSSNQMLPPSSRQETFASEDLFRVTGASLTFSTPFCAAQWGLDGMAGPDLSERQSSVLWPNLWHFQHLSPWVCCCCWRGALKTCPGVCVDDGAGFPEKKTCSSSPRPGLITIAAAAATVVRVRSLGLLQRVCLPFLQAVKTGCGEFINCPLPPFVQHFRCVQTSKHGIMHGSKHVQLGLCHRHCLMQKFDEWDDYT